METKIIIIMMAVVAFTASVAIIIIDRNKEKNEKAINQLSTMIGSRGVAERLYTFIKNIIFLFCIAIIIGAFIALG